MAGQLPAHLVADTRRTIDYVVGLTLPAHRWPAIWATLERIDFASYRGDAPAIQRSLLELPRPPGPPPMTAAAESDGFHQFEGAVRPPMSQGGPVRTSTTTRRWVIVICAVAVLGLVAIASGAFALTRMDDSPGITATRTTATRTTASPNATAPETPSAEGSDGTVEAVAAVGAGLVVLMAVGLIAVILRSRRSEPAPRHIANGASAAAPLMQPAGIPAPHELVEFANRTVWNLHGYRGEA